MNNTVKTMALSAAAAISLMSCDHKELCMDHDPHALRYHAAIEADYTRVWEYTQPGQTNWKHSWPLGYEPAYDTFIPGYPTGLRALVYGEDGNPRITNMDTFGGDLMLAAGVNDILFYNNDTEYIVYDGMGSMLTATATTRTRLRPTYVGSPFFAAPVENTVSAPDMLYASSVTGYEPEKTIDPVPMKVSMTPVVFTYYIRFEFKSGLKYVALTRGALAGMAAGVNLYTGRTTDDRVTVMFDAEQADFGVWSAVRSFGAPSFDNSHYGNHADVTYGLNLEVMLRNGKIKKFDFDITDQIKRQPQGGVIVVSGLEITDAEGLGGSSGFDVDVDGWGEFEDIPLELK